MASENKKRKCQNTLLDRGGEKGKLFRLKRDAMYHKKDRNYNKKMCKESEAPNNEKWDFCPNCGAKMESEK